MTLWQVRTRVRDVPGKLAQLAAALGEIHGNVVDVDVHGCDIEHVLDDLYVDVPEAVNASDLDAVLTAVEQGAPAVNVRRARAEELVDGPSRALGLMARLVDDPGTLPGLLCQLVGGDSAELAGQRPPETPHQLVVPVPWYEGYVVIRRSWAPFTLTEQARVGRFAAAAAALERDSVVGGTHAILSDGSELRLRAGGPDDAGHVADLLDRCSAPSRELRFMSNAATVPSTWLSRLASPPEGFSVLAFADSGELVGMAQCLPFDEPGCSEIAVLVEDAWQHRGVGTMMLRTLARRARTDGIDEIVAVSLTHNVGPERLFARAGLRTVTSCADGVREVRSRLRAPSQPSPVAAPAAVRAAVAAVASPPAPEPAGRGVAKVSPLRPTNAVLRGRQALQAWARTQNPGPPSPSA